MAARFANVSDVPLALAVFLASDYYDYNDDPTTISATTLLKPIRQIVLPHRIPQGEGLVPLADMMDNRMGAAMHDGIEKSWVTNYRPAMEALGFPRRVIDRVRVNPDDSLLKDPDAIPVYLEQRLTRRLGKWKITGKFDFVGEGKVQDFKRTSVWVYRNQVNSNKWSQQGSIYRWLGPHIITRDEMDIHYLFKDWQQSRMKADPNYPRRRFHTQSFPLTSVQETQAFIQRKLDQIEAYWDAPEEEIPHCNDEDLWRSEPVFKYYRDPSKVTGRSTKNFATRQEAMQRYVDDGSKGLVKEVPGQVTACKYCPAFLACSQKDLLIERGDLDMAPQQGNFNNAFV